MSAVESSRPRVALVHDWLTGMRGGEKVLEALASLFPTAPIYTLIHLRGRVSGAIEGHDIKTSFLQLFPGIRRHYRRYLPLFPTAIESFDFTPYDVIVSSSHCVAKGARPRPGAYHLCYCHTPMRYVWDQESAYFPKRTGVVARVRGLILSKLRRWDVRSAGRVDHFIANSTFVAERIDRYYSRQAEVVHPPVDTEFFTPDDRQRGDYCLMVSALSPYKRIDLAIEACIRLGLELRIVGDGPERQRLVRRAGVGVRFMASVSDEELRNLYRGALCLVQPGVEDFGISSVEALACGCPVVALQLGGVADIVHHEKHGVLYPGPGDAQALASAIDKSKTFGFNKLNLRRRAEEFSAANFKDRLTSSMSRRLSGWDLF